jgi:hypothetical protein
MDLKYVQTEHDASAVHLVVTSTILIAKIFHYQYSYISPQNRPRRPRGRADVQLYFFFILGTRWGLSGNAMLRPLYPPNDPKVGRAPGPVWTGAENLANPNRIRSSNHPARSDLLYQLCSPDPLFHYQHNIKLKFPRVWTLKATQSLCFHHDIVTEGCFQYFTHFQSSFPEFGKSITYITRSFKSFIRKSWIALNIHSNDPVFRRKAESYNSHTLQTRSDQIAVRCWQLP